MKNTFFIKKKCPKIALFLCVLCVFSAFLQNRKIFTSTKFFFAFSPWPPVNIRATTGRSWADHGQIMGDKQTVQKSSFEKKIREKFFTKKSFACKFRYYTHIACKII